VTPSEPGTISFASVDDDGSVRFILSSSEGARGGVCFSSVFSDMIVSVVLVERMWYDGDRKVAREQKSLGSLES
jgi:hypothetical protein